MICCCSDGTRTVIFKLERLDYMAVYVSGGTSRVAVIAALSALEGVSDVVWRDEGFYEVYVAASVTDAAIRSAVEAVGSLAERID